MTTNPHERSVPERLLKALDGADPLEVLRKTPRRIRKLIRGAKKQDLEFQPAAGAWSVKEVLCHLADHEFVVGARLRFVGAEDRPPLAGYDQQQFLARLGADSARAQDLAEELAGARAANLGLLARLPQDAFDRIGVHAERGELTLMSLVLATAGHDRVHEAQIARTLAAARAGRRARKASSRARPAG